MIKRSIFLSLAGLALLGQDSLTLDEAIHRAWSQQPGLLAGDALVDRAKADADAQYALRYPTLTAAAGVTRSDEPMMAFGTKLNQARITQADFNPASLNHPAPITAAGGTVSLNQPLYAGGRLQAAYHASAHLAQAEEAAQAHRRQQVALAVVQAYFGAQVAEQGVRFAEDTLRQAQETERFVRLRVEQGLVLKSEGDRARAFRAQSEAGLMEAKQRLSSAQSGLALLMGTDEVSEQLVTPLETEAPGTPGAGTRGDLESARWQAEAAREGLNAQQGTLKPEIGLTVTAGTARYQWGEGGNWASAAIGAKWTFSFAELKKVQVSRASVRAAELNEEWLRRQASHDIGEAQRAMDTANAKMSAAKTAVEASESARAIRTARHREGLLPLMEVLDAEAGLAGARTLLLNSELEWRVSRAQRALALGQPIEDVKE